MLPDSHPVGLDCDTEKVKNALQVAVCSALYHPLRSVGCRLSDGGRLARLGFPRLAIYSTAIYHCAGTSAAALSCCVCALRPAAHPVACGDKTRAPAADWHAVE